MILIVDDPVPWRLDEETREIGRKGLAQARAVLDASRPVPLDDVAA